MKFRRAVFWIHLSAGVAAAGVILIMAATGVMLAYEPQIMAWARRQYRVANSRGRQALPVSAVLAHLPQAPSALTLRADPGAALEISYGRDRIVFLDPYSGETLGESRRLPAFFAQVENLHRRLGVAEAHHRLGQAITGACNLAFLLLVCTGPLLWWPRDWTWTNLRKVLFFRRDLSGRARFWNWHNVLGSWCVAPLLVIVLTGVILSYGWATDLLYRLTGNQAPSRPASAQEKSGREHQPRLEEATGARASDLDRMVAAAKQTPRWRTITLRTPTGRGPLSATVDQGNGGRPDLRSQFTLDPKTGEVRQEAFSDYNSGRRLRAWARFSHTGEAAGPWGQSIAAAAAAGASLLAITGILLSFKRWRVWKSRADRPQMVIPDDSPG
ncbi:MAG TPA: PepSY-associated TM helix domain-containing protein [Terriglobales bacterium]